jgi:hypothetical protein
MELIRDAKPETPEERAAECEAMLRIINVLSEERPKVKTEHWCMALRSLHSGLSNAVVTRGYRPSLEEAG